MANWSASRQLGLLRRLGQLGLKGFGFVIRRSSVQIPLLAIRWVSVWWSMIQLLRALQIANWSAIRQLGFLRRFCSIYNICFIITVPSISAVVLKI